MESPAPLHLQPRPSRCLALWLGGLHLAALAALWHSAFADPARWLLGGGIAALGAWSGVRHWRDAPRRSLLWTAEGHWIFQPAGRPPLVIRDWDAPWVTPTLVLLRLRTGAWRYRHLVLCADSLDAEPHRRLRVRLRGAQVAARSCPESGSSARAGPDR